MHYAFDRWMELHFPRLPFCRYADDGLIHCRSFRQAQYLKHGQYGLGVVTQSNADRTTIDFDLHGIKKFVTTLMVVETAEGTPPKRARAKRRKKITPTPALAAAAAGVK